MRRIANYMAEKGMMDVKKSRPVNLNDINAILKNLKSNIEDEAGNVTKISPHNSQGEWEYFSKNTKTGKVFRVNMEKMIRKLEEITGESFIEEWREDIK